MRRRGIEKTIQQRHDITIMDVANEAGVSPATVSRVINNQDHVKLEKRERVLRAMARLGYVANTQARSLAGGATHVIGLLVSYLSLSYTVEILQGIDDTLLAHQYDLILYRTHMQGREESAYVTDLTRKIADGLLLILPQPTHEYLEALRQRHFPHVLVDFLSNGSSAPSVTTTNDQGAYDAVTYLLELGHRRIGCITGLMETGCAQQRLAGYRAALNQHGISEDPQLIRHGAFQPHNGFQSAHELLALPDPPTAIFASNDLMAFGAMEAARARGLHIPDDLSIIGFDDIPQSALFHPPLTTIQQPFHEMGKQAAHLLLHYIAHPNAEVERRKLPTKLVIRQSCQAYTRKK